jgi:hypothetical protein
VPPGGCGFPPPSGGNQKADRSAIMRNAHKIRRDYGISLSDALKQAWAEAKGASQLAGAAVASSDSGRLGPEPGLAGAFRRYGLDKLAARAARLVARLTEELLNYPKQPMLPSPGVLEARRNEDGTFSV